MNIWIKKKKSRDRKGESLEGFDCSFDVVGSHRPLQGEKMDGARGAKTSCVPVFMIFYVADDICARTPELFIVKMSEMTWDSA